MKVWTASVFTLVYACFVFILKAIRSDAEERNHWRFLMMNIVLGCLCGPLAFLFTNVFPEHSTNSDIARNIFWGCIYGNAVLITLGSRFLARAVLINR